MKILSKPEELDDKTAVLELMTKLLDIVKSGKIEITHYWLFQDYIDTPVEEPHHWFGFEWRMKEDNNEKRVD